MKFFLFIVLGLFGAVTATSRTITVGSDAKSIKGAIQVAGAGDTIRLLPGIYREGNIVINKSLTISGDKGAILDGEGKFEIFTIHGTDVTIDGLTFINTGVASISDIAAIKVLDSKRIRITNNDLKDTFFGIYLANSGDSHVSNNRIVSTVSNEFSKGNGIHLWKCQNIRLYSNTVEGHRDGIYFEFVTKSKIVNNKSTGNLRYGLHFMFSHDDEYRNNVFSNNGAGVAVMYSKNVTMIDNSFNHNWGSAAYGLLLKDIRDSQVTRNEFEKNSVGIFMEGTSRITFSENVFRRNGYAIRLQASCDDNNLNRNNFLGNTFDIVTNGSLVLNKIDGNYWDKYEGYDLNHDMVGDICYRPVSLYGTIIEQTPTAVLLWRSFLVTLIDRAEKAIPAITPENLNDAVPLMKPYDILH
jgi:nitrous oxidase accessory protein